ncbi:MAG: carbonate dehydratase [Chloroflexales bacterium]|nr:carbonate dehydratase [Chloroflexales bacterium]
MRTVEELLANNSAWAEAVTTQDPYFFQRLTGQQTPAYLWIGCSDSRVPATQLVGLLPGEMFVHRNVANIVAHTDFNCLSVLQYAVEVLQVDHIIVCGHYRCGGIHAALHSHHLGLIDNWLQHVQDVRRKHASRLAACGDTDEEERRLSELNVIEQVVNVSQTTIVQKAWLRGQQLTVYGWIYGVEDGLLRDLQIRVSGLENLDEQYTRAVELVR